MTETEQAIPFMERWCARLNIEIGEQNGSVEPFKKLGLERIPNDAQIEREGSGLKIDFSTQKESEQPRNVALKIIHAGGGQVNLEVYLDYAIMLRTPAISIFPELLDEMMSDPNLALAVQA